MGKKKTPSRHSAPSSPPLPGLRQISERHFLTTRLGYTGSRCECQTNATCLSVRAEVERVGGAGGRRGRRGGGKRMIADASGNCSCCCRSPRWWMQTLETLLQSTCVCVCVCACVCVCVWLCVCTEAEMQSLSATFWYLACRNFIDSCGLKVLRVTTVQLSPFNRIKPCVNFGDRTALLYFAYFDFLPGVLRSFSCTPKPIWVIAHFKIIASMKDRRTAIVCKLSP